MPLTKRPETNAAEIERTSLSRRTLVTKGGLLAGATALIASSSVAHAQDTSLSLEVAMDGRTFAINRPAGVDPDTPVSRGDTFVVQGSVYPAGTIDDGLRGPTQQGRIGHWVCRGWFYYSLDEIMEGAVPHVVTTQNFLLDSFDGLVTDGMEGGVFAVRAVTGGYGIYRNVSGEVAQTEVEFNDTSADLGSGVVVPVTNFRFDFRLTGV